MRKSLVLEPLEGFASETGRRILTTGGHFAYLKIAEGCDKHCTYCIIPKVGETTGAFLWRICCGKRKRWQNRGEGTDPGSSGDDSLR